MANEEQIIQFIEHELTPEQERALMDECAESDETRGLLKQHVSLSRNMAATLSSIAVPAAATEKLDSRLAEMRATKSAAPSGVSFRNGVLTAIAGVAVIGIVTLAVFLPKNTAAPTTVATPVPAPPATIVSAEPAPVQPPAQQAVKQRHSSIHHRIAAEPTVAEKPVVVPGKTVAPKKSKTAIKLDKPDEVHGDQFK